MKMKKIPAAIAALAIVAISAVYPATPRIMAEGDANVFYDGSAERDLTGCSSWAYPNESAAYNIDPTVTNNGKASLKFNIPSGSNSILDVSAPISSAFVSAGDKVKVSGYIKANVLSSNGGAALILTAKPSGGGASFNFVVCGYYPSTTDWIYIEQTAVAAQDLKLDILLHTVQWSTGTFWFQGVKAEKVTDTPGPPDPPEPPSPDSNLIYDGYAETDQTGCSSWEFPHQDSAFGTDSAVKNNGQPSLKISLPPAKGNAIVTLTVPFTPVSVVAGDKIKLSGYIKSNVSSSDVGAGVILRGQPDIGDAIDFVTCGYYPNTTDWMFVEKTVTVTQALTLKQVFYTIQWSTGDFWFQGFKAEKVTDEPAPPPPPPKAPEIIYDGEAERSLTGTIPWGTRNPNDATVFIDSTVKRDGKNSLKINIPAGDNAIQDLAVPLENMSLEKGDRVKLSGYIKANIVSSLGGVKVILSALRADGSRVDFAASTYYSQTTGWEYSEVIITAMEPLVLDRLLHTVQWSVGEFWFQGIKAERLTPEKIEGMPENFKDDSGILKYSLYPHWMQMTGSESLNGSKLNGKWATWSPVKGSVNDYWTPNISVDKSVTHNGYTSIKMTNTKNCTTSSLFTAISVKPGEKYKVTGYVKTENLTYIAGVNDIDKPNLGARFNMQYFKKAAQTDVFKSEYQINWDDVVSAPDGTNGWTKLTKTFVIPPDCAVAQFAVNLWGSTGTAWFSEIRLEKVIPDPNVFYNGELEAEADMAGYPTWIYTGENKEPKAAISNDRTVKRDGKPSLKFTATESSLADLYIPLGVTLKKGDSIKLSGWIKSQNVEGLGGQISVTEASADGVFMAAPYVPNAADWTYVEKVYTMPEDMELKRLSYSLVWATGTIWFQGVRLERTTEQGATGELDFLEPEYDDTGLGSKITDEMVEDAITNSDSDVIRFSVKNGAVFTRYHLRLLMATGKRIEIFVYNDADKFLTLWKFPKIVSANENFDVSVIEEPEYSGTVLKKLGESKAQIISFKPQNQRPNNAEIIVPVRQDFAADKEVYLHRINPENGEITEQNLAFSFMNECKYIKIDSAQICDYVLTEYSDHAVSGSASGPAPTLRIVILIEAAVLFGFLGGAAFFLMKAGVIGNRKLPVS